MRNGHPATVEIKLGRIPRMAFANRMLSSLMQWKGLGKLVDKAVRRSQKLEPPQKSC
jgi:hypothetical protein